MKWEKVKLSEVTEYITDGDHQPAPKSDSGVLFVKIKDIQDNCLTFDNALFVPQEYYNQLPKNRKAVYGDTLYTVVGSYGIPAFVNHNIPFCFERNIALLHPNNRVIPKYLYYAVKNPIFYGNANNIANGSAQKLIPLSKLAGMEVSVPPIERQETIVNILSAYDELIENNQKQIKLLEEAAQRLYKEWFVDLRFPGHETTPIVDGVPEGWTYKPFSEVFDYVRGKSYTSKELSDTTGILMANLKNIRAFGGYNRNAEKRFTGQYKANQMLYAGDIVMGVTDMTQERRLVGHVALVPDLGEKMTFSMDLIKIIPKLTDNLFLYSAMYYGGLSKQISPLANGVNVLHLKPEAMMGIEMLTPTKDILERYHQQFAPMVTRIEALQKQCDVAAEARDRLIPKLMNREIEV